MLRATSEVAFTVWGSSSKRSLIMPQGLSEAQIYTTFFQALSSCNSANQLLCAPEAKTHSCRSISGHANRAKLICCSQLKWCYNFPFLSLDFLPSSKDVPALISQNKKCLLTTALLKFPGQDLGTKWAPTLAQIDTKDWTTRSNNIFTHPYPNSASRVAVLTRLEGQLTAAIP